MLKSVQIYLPQDPCRRKSGKIKFYFLSFFHLALLLRNKIYFKFYTEVFRFGVRDEDFFNESTFLHMYIIVYSHRAMVHSRKCRAVYKFSSKEMQGTKKIYNLSNWNLADQSQSFRNMYTWWEVEGILYYMWSILAWHFT